MTLAGVWRAFYLPDWRPGTSVFDSLEPAGRYRASYQDDTGKFAGECDFGYAYERGWDAADLFKDPSGPGGRYTLATEAALVRLWLHFGRRPFAVRLTNPASTLDGGKVLGSWVIGRCGGDEAGVFLGACGPESYFDTTVEKRGVKAGAVYSGDSLGEALYP